MSDDRIVVTTGNLSETVEEKTVPLDLVALAVGLKEDTVRDLLEHGYSLTRQLGSPTTWIQDQYRDGVQSPGKG